MTLEEMFEKLKEFLKIYPSGIQIWILERDKRARKAIVPLKKLFNFKYYFHLSRTKEICFQPFTFEALYVDDPDPDTLSEIPCTYYKVITSYPSKYQIHIPIPPVLQKAYQDHRLRNLLQRCICEFLKAETVSGWKAFRKLPFTQNAKYDPPPIITAIKHESQNHIDNFLKLLDMLNPLWKKYYDTYCLTQTKPDTERKRTTKLKAWTDFYEGDESIADIKYAVYLFSRGFSYSEVENALLKESLNLHQRKKGHLADYLKRTLQKALEYSKSTYNPPLTNSKT